MVTASKSKTRQPSLRDSVKIRGFFRLEIFENKDGEIRFVERTPWIPNLITNSGYDNYICRSVGAISGSSQVSYAALGTGGAPVATDTSLSGELGDAASNRIALTPSTIASKTLQFTGSLNSNIITTTHAISNIGLFDRSNTQAGTICAGNTYTSSTLNTNNIVNATYQLRFS